MVSQHRPAYLILYLKQLKSGLQLKAGLHTPFQGEDTLGHAGGTL